MFTKAQVRTFQTGLSVAEKHKATIDKLAEIAKHAPQFADRVAELAKRREYAEKLASTALSVDPTGD